MLSDWTSTPDNGDRPWPDLRVASRPCRWATALPPFSGKQGKGCCEAEPIVRARSGLRRICDGSPSSRLACIERRILDATRTGPRTPAAADMAAIALATATVAVTNSVSHLAPAITARATPTLGGLCVRHPVPAPGDPGSAIRLTSDRRTMTASRPAKASTRSASRASSPPPRPTSTTAPSRRATATSASIICRATRRGSTRSRASRVWRRTTTMVGRRIGPGRNGAS